jgi:hypothetical protein
MSKKDLKQFFLNQTDTTIDRQHKKCIYCNKDVFTTGICCSRKSCIRNRINYQAKKSDKHGKFLESIINYQDKNIEQKVTQ